MQAPVALSKEGSRIGMSHPMFIARVDWDNEESWSGLGEICPLRLQSTHDTPTPTFHQGAVPPANRRMDGLVMNGLTMAGSPTLSFAEGRRE